MPISDRHESFMSEPPRVPPPSGRLSPGYQPPSAGDLFAKLAQILSDPRNGWIGLGPLAGALRGPRLLQQIMEQGGFSVPTQMMRRQTGYHGLQDERTMRDMFQDHLRNFNQTATNMYRGNPLDMAEANEYYSNLRPEARSMVDRVFQGQQNLKAANDLARSPGEGGRPVNRAEEHYLEELIRQLVEAQQRQKGQP